MHLLQNKINEPFYVENMNLHCLFKFHNVISHEDVNTETTDSKSI